MNYDDLIEKLEAISIKFETYNDYPESASNNAKRALSWVEENGWGSCGTATGKKRARQLAKKHGLFVGISAGANVLAAETWLFKNTKSGNAITILCDRGERYFSCL